MAHLKLYINNIFVGKFETSSIYGGKYTITHEGSRLTFRKSVYSEGFYDCNEEQNVKAIIDTGKKGDFIPKSPSINRYLGLNYHNDKTLACARFLTDSLKFNEYIVMNGSIIGENFKDIESAIAWAQQVLFSWQNAWLKSPNGEIFRVNHKTHMLSTIYSLLSDYGIKDSNLSNITLNQAKDMAQQFDLQDNVKSQTLDNVNRVYFCHEGINTLVDSLEHLKQLLLSSFHISTKTNNLILIGNSGFKVTCDMWIKDNDNGTIKAYYTIDEKSLSLTLDKDMKHATCHGVWEVAERSHSGIIRPLKKEILTHDPMPIVQAYKTPWYFGNKAKQVDCLAHNESVKGKGLFSVELSKHGDLWHDVLFDKQVVAKYALITKVYRLVDLNDMPLYETKTQDSLKAYVALYVLKSKLDMPCEISNLSITIGSVRIFCLNREYIINVMSKGLIISCNHVGSIKQYISDYKDSLIPEIKDKTPYDIFMDSTVTANHHAIICDNVVYSGSGSGRNIVENSKSGIAVIKKLEGLNKITFSLLTRKDKSNVVSTKISRSEVRDYVANSQSPKIETPMPERELTPIEQFTQQGGGINKLFYNKQSYEHGIASLSDMASLIANKIPHGSYGFIKQGHDFYMVTLRYPVAKYCTKEDVFNLWDKNYHIEESKEQQKINLSKLETPMPVVETHGIVASQPIDIMDMIPQKVAPMPIVELPKVSLIRLGDKPQKPQIALNCPNCDKEKRQSARMWYKSGNVTCDHCGKFAHCGQWINRNSFDVIVQHITLKPKPTTQPKMADLEQLISMAACYIRGKLSPQRACEVLKKMATETDYSALLAHYGIAPVAKVEAVKVEAAPIAHAPVADSPVLRIERNKTVQNPRMYCFNILSNEELIGSITKFLGPWEVSIKDKTPVSFASMGQAESWVMGLMA